MYVFPSGIDFIGDGPPLLHDVFRWEGGYRLEAFVNGTAYFIGRFFRIIIIIRTIATGSALLYIVHLRVGRWTCILYRSKDATPDRSVKIFRLGEIDIGCIINCTQPRSGWN